MNNMYKPTRNNAVAFGLCALSYCDNNGVDQVLNWAKTSVKTLILAEVTDVEEGREKIWDDNQQMIGRNKADYSKKFREAGMNIKEEVEYTKEMTELGLLPMCYWILEM